jgi:hypothetical protein
MLCIFYKSGILQVVSEHFPWQKLWVFFFRVDTYSSVFKPQRSLITRMRETKKCKWLSAHLLATLVTPVGTPSSGSTSGSTCVWIGLDFLKPSLDKPIDRQTVIVSPRTALRKILSSTWVVG